MVKTKRTSPILRTNVWLETDGLNGACPLVASNHMTDWAQLNRVDAIAHNSDGSVDFDTLKHANAIDPEAEDDPVARVIALVMEDILEQTNLRVTSDFFALGGSSIQAVQLAQRLADLLLTDISMSSIFQAPNAAKLATLLRQRETEQGLVDAAALEVLDLLALSESDVQDAAPQAAQ